MTTDSNVSSPLAASFDALLFDLDGVLYIGEEPVAFAASSLEEVAARFGTRRAYITNNASRTPEQVVGVLAAVGVGATVSEIVTSAQVAASHLASELPAGSAVLVIGGEGLVRALEVNGLRAVRSLDESPAAVVQGFHPDVGWRDLAMASVAVARGLPWVASNADLTIPTADGLAPGNGTLIRAVSTATGKTPLVVGKPNTPAVLAAIDRCHSKRPMIVGDRLDTDIEAANRAGINSLLVMTGVTDVEAVAHASPEHRPSYICLDLRGLLRPYLAPIIGGDIVSCGGWQFRTTAEGVKLIDSGNDGDLGLRALAVACWRATDEGASVGPAQLDAVSAVAAAVAREMAASS